MITEAYNEKYRPQYHFTPPAMWMNDPNGMVYFQGEYHLFYQYHPEGITWGPMHWGHAVSTDLVHWEHLSIALKPDHNGFIFSGSAVVDWSDTSGFFSGQPGLVAMFTHADQYPESERPRQRQSLAYSADKGRTWVMYEGNPVLCNEQITDFRDPKVFWYTAGGHWVMVVAAGDRIQMYTSSNLKDWTYASEFGAAEGSHDGVWECPDLIELPVEGKDGISKWVLIVSIGDHPELPEGSRTQYFIGSFNGYSFMSESSDNSVLWLDYGRDNYAGVTWSDAHRDKQEKIFIGWMSNWKYANQTPTSTWRSAMTIPRELMLRETETGIRLVQTPIPELQKLRLHEQAVHQKNITISPGENPLEDMNGVTYELVCEMELGDASEVGFKLRTSPQEETVIGYQTASQTLYVDRSKSGESSFHHAFPCRHEVQVQPKKGRILFHIYVDHSSIEVFVNEGEVVITDQIFPNPASTGAELYVYGGESRVVSLSYFPLQSMYSFVTA
ncbi:glycoside hydrolase family 32 protein [Paenibacillus hexagrammi]|uniref:Glycoside hydrolase family 32 protein n=1 Tax=Paenibacillus hexagrammi TaxID=2908839 RepID=A0ABY3SGT7_9BACL|nr:glycoside hydrolase family 32 protein [Paenibacillus sp. YPD9-1]UJF32394.1 glycoside hydrolase family 32 protein [Paenibacillus sp. YPD9-1]